MNDYKKSESENQKEIENRMIDLRSQKNLVIKNFRKNLENLKINFLKAVLGIKKDE